MKVALINSVCGIGSTGKICVGISKILFQKNVDNRIYYTSGVSRYPLSVKYSHDWYIKLQAVKSKIIGNYGFNSRIATYRLISLLKKYNPDIVHIHNIHGHDCNFEMLLRYLKENNMKVVWTFHDCWPFTGYCTYFTIAGCNKWKTGCSCCPEYKKSSWFFDKSSLNYNLKKDSFSGMDLTVVTPSEWLAELVQESFLKHSRIKVINNGIDLETFKPTISQFRKQYNCEDKYIILGVSFEWEKRKGLDIFIELAQILPDSFQIVLVGTNSVIDKQLPNNIISIHRTNTQVELAKIYSAADLLINPTREENFPTVNIESLACGTPVLTFATGGSAEIIDSSCGIAVETGNFDKLLNTIFEIQQNKPFTETSCLDRAQKYSRHDKFEEYYALYRQIMKEKA